MWVPGVGRTLSMRSCRTPTRPPPPNLLVIMQVWLITAKRINQTCMITQGWVRRINQTCMITQGVVGAITQGVVGAITRGVGGGGG